MIYFRRSAIESPRLIGRNEYDPPAARARDFKMCWDLSLTKKGIFNV